MPTAQLDAKAHALMDAVAARLANCDQADLTRIATDAQSYLCGALDASEAPLLRDLAHAQGELLKMDAHCAPGAPELMRERQTVGNVVMAVCMASAMARDLTHLTALHAIAVHGGLGAPEPENPAPAQSPAVGAAPKTPKSAF